MQTGVAGSIAWPIVYSVCSHWAPRGEVGRALLIGATGLPLGQALILLTGGAECAHLGWPWVFWLITIAQVAYAVFWFTFFRYPHLPTPSSQPWTDGLTVCG